jgi:hypothetical protein
MGNRGRLIFGILIIVLVPVFAFGIWKEVENSSQKDLEENLNKKIPQNALTFQNASQANNQAKNKTAPVTPQSKAGTPNTQKVAAAEDAAENKSEEAAKNEENSTEKEDAEKNNYENKELGISFEYPKEYSVVSDGNKVITVSKGNISWKIRFYDDKNKEDIQIWFGNKFNKKDNLDCTFIEPEIKAGMYEGKLVKSGIDEGKCDDEGNYTISSDKAKIIRIYEGEETKENINKILESFKFLN